MLVTHIIALLKKVYFFLYYYSAYNLVTAIKFDEI